MEHSNPIANCLPCADRFRFLRCDCGAAELGHSPDCLWVRSVDALAADHDDEVYAAQAA